MAVNTYLPGQTAVSVGGYPMSGWADGEFISVAFASEGATMVVGADGEATHVIPSNTAAVMTLTFKQDADANRILGGLVDNATLVKVTLRDNLGFNLFSKDCLVRRHADRAYAVELGNRVWEINMPNAVAEYPTGTTPAS